MLCGRASTGNRARSRRREGGHQWLCRPSCTNTRTFRGRPRGRSAARGSRSWSACVRATGSQGRCPAQIWSGRPAGTVRIGAAMAGVLGLGRRRVSCRVPGGPGMNPSPASRSPRAAPPVAATCPSTTAGPADPADGGFWDHVPAESGTRWAGRTSRFARCSAVRRITVTVRRIVGSAQWPEHARGTMMAL